MSVYATCEQRGVNFYQFVQDSGRQDQDNSIRPHVGPSDSCRLTLQGSDDATNSARHV